MPFLPRFTQLCHHFRRQERRPVTSQRAGQGRWGAEAGSPQPSGLECSPCRGSAPQSVRILPALLHGSDAVDAREGESVPSFMPPAALATRLQLLMAPVLPGMPQLQRWAWLAQGTPQLRRHHSCVCLYTDTATEDAQTNQPNFFPCNPHTDVRTAMHYAAAATTGTAQS